MERITQDMRFRQSLMRYAERYGVALLIAKLNSTPKTPRGRIYSYKFKGGIYSYKVRLVIFTFLSFSSKIKVQKTPYPTD